MTRLLPCWALLIAACGGSPDPEEPSATQRQHGPTGAAPHAEPPRDVILIIVDTCRADAAAEAATPNIDALAASGFSVPQAWSAGTWTVPSVISLLSGLPVRQHGWDLPTGRLGRYPALPSAPMLPVVMRDAGFDVTGLYANPYLAEELGFREGFATWRRIPDRAMAKAFGEIVEASWTEEGRHFAYLHLLGPHSPLRPSADAKARWNVEEEWFDEEKRGLDIGVAKRNNVPGAREAYSKAYRAVIEDTDAIVGALLDALGPHRDHTLVVLTSDHGELLGEHDKAGHGRHVWQGLTHVPLVVSGPGTPDRRPETMSITEIPNLITTAVGVTHTWPSPRTEDGPLVAQREGRVAMLLDGRWRGVWDQDLDGRAVFDIVADPGEEVPLADDHGLDAAKLAWDAAVPAGTTSDTLVTLDEQTQHQLELLGYVESESQAPSTTGP